MIKHSGVEKTGGLTDNELLNFMEVVRGGKIADDSFEQFNNKIRYAYDLNKNGVNFRVVIDEYNDGKKVFDYYSDRNFIDYSQKGNLVNEKEANGLRDSVSSIGDNASRAGGRQAGDEQILRQGRRDTANASQTKRPAQSDEQVERQWAAKADGEADAAAAGEQVVEKQGGGNNEVARRFTIDDAINAKLNFINENNLGKEGWLDKLNAVIKKYDLKEAETKNEFMGVMIRDRFKYGREFDFPSINDVMPKISPLKPQYHEILNGAHKELNEILKNKTIPATREQNLKFHAANSNAHLGSGLVAGTLNSIDEDGNFSPERFAAGFLAGLAGSKAAAVALKKVAPKLYENLTNTAKSFSDKGIKKIRGEIEKINGITPIKEFGENYAEFYHNGKGTVQKLLAEEQGQVAGAFYRDDLGDITLPWGEAGTGRSDGWGLAKIKRFHPEVMDRLDEIIRDGKFYFDEKDRPNIKLGDEIVGLKDNWLGKETPYWIVSSYDKSLKARPSEGINSARSKKAIGENFSSEIGHETIIPQNLDDAASNLPKPEDIIAKHPNVERELDESIAAMRKESFNDSNFKDGLISKFDTKKITTQELGKSVNLSDKQLAVLKNDIKNADFKVISDSKIYFDKVGKDGDKKRFFVDIAQDGSLRVDAYAKSQIDNIPVKQSALEELADVGDAARLKGMSFEVKAAYRNELDPIKKEAILKTAEYNALKKEMRGIYNTINNGKESTNIYKDLQKIESAIKLEQGSKKKGGAVHIQKHLDPSAKGAVTQQEVMSIGESVREYIKKYKEPFVDKDSGKIYEWQDKDGVRFRVAVYDKIKKSVGAGSTTRITTTDAYESIIMFYSDRNLNGRMDFLDPRLRAETKFEEFKAKNLDENGNIKDGLSLC